MLTQKRNTVAKRAVLELIHSSGVALAHSDIQSKLENLCDRVTIYRVLDRLVEEGSIHRIVNVDGVIKYADCTLCSAQHHQHHHVHFSCKECGNVTCLEHVFPEFLLPNGYATISINCVVEGICPNCSTKAKHKAKK